MILQNLKRFGGAALQTHGVGLQLRAAAVSRRCGGKSESLRVFGHFWSQKYRAADINKINGLIKNKTKCTNYFVGFLFLQTINFNYAYGVVLFV